MLFNLLKAALEKFPHKTLREGEICISYSSFLRSVQTLAESLTQHKYGILCDSELSSAVAILAVFAAGKTAVPLSHRYGQAHCEKIIEVAGISHILTDEGGILHSRKIGPVQNEEEDLTEVAAILCTSGTTGMPKGAMITQANFIANLQAVLKYFAIDQTDTILISRPLYHCAVFTGEFMAALVKGLDIVFYSQLFNPTKIIQQIEQNHTTVMCGTPTMFYHICTLAQRWKTPLPLKKIVVSGECMGETVAAIIKKAWPQAQVYNVYGLTEASPRVSWLPPELFAENPTSVGIPLEGIEVKLQEGELLVKGPNVMKGYYNNPAATRRALQNGWLHTGDIAEIKDGLLYIKCRKDDMIIRAGMNIYPQEIENALKQNKQITDILAYGVKDEKVGMKIYAKVVSEKLDKSGVFAYCRQVLPGYQIPDKIEIVESIPRNGSGKVIRSKA